MTNGPPTASQRVGQAAAVRTNFAGRPAKVFDNALVERVFGGKGGEEHAHVCLWRREQLGMSGRGGARQLLIVRNAVDLARTAPAPRRADERTYARHVELVHQVLQRNLAADERLLAS